MVPSARYPADVTVQTVTKETGVIPALTVTMVKHVVCVLKQVFIGSNSSYMF